MYQEIINQMFLDADDEDRSGDMKLHPSAISVCERNAIYQARGEPVSNERDVRFTRIMGNGTDYHQKLQDYMKRKVPGVLLEVPVDYGPIHGRCDALLSKGDIHKTGEWHYELQEFKTISPNGMRYIQGLKPKLLKSGKWNKSRPAAPKPEHEKQARIYHLGLTLAGQYHLTDIIRLVYIDRDDWSTLEFEVEPWTEEEGQAYLENMAELEGHLFDGTLPAREDDDYWLCNLCPFRTTCKPDQYPQED